MEHISQVTSNLMRKIQPRIGEGGQSVMQMGLQGAVKDTDAYDIKVYLNKDRGTITHRVNGKYATTEMPTAVYRQLLGLPQEQSVAYAEAPATYGAVDGVQQIPNASLNGAGTKLVHKVGELEFSKHVNYYKAILGVEFTRSKLSRAPRANR